MKPTQALLARIRRLPLTTKQARKGFYKGTGTKQLGAFDVKNPRRFIPDWQKIRTYVVPNIDELNTSQLKPFVAKNVHPKYIPGTGGTYTIAKKKFTGQDYLDLWKEKGGNDDVAYLKETRQDRGFD